MRSLPACTQQLFNTAGSPAHSSSITSTDASAYGVLVLVSTIAEHFEHNLVSKKIREKEQAHLSQHRLRARVPRGLSGYFHRVVRNKCHLVQFRTFSYEPKISSEK